MKKPCKSKMRGRRLPKSSASLADNSSWNYLENGINLIMTRLRDGVNMEIVGTRSLSTKIFR